MITCYSYILASPFTESGIVGMYYLTVERIFSLKDPKIYWTAPLATIACLIPDLFYKGYKRRFSPDFLALAKEVAADPDQIREMYDSSSGTKYEGTGIELLDRIQETQLTNERRSAGEIKTEVQKNGNGKQAKVSVSDIEMSTVSDKPTRSMSARVAWEETHSSISMDDSSSHKLAHNIRTMINIRKFIANLNPPRFEGRR